MEEFRGSPVGANSQKAIELYNKVKDLPIIDYHCHLSPKEIYEDKKFSNIGEMWLAGDHYKWRLMRTAGISEDYITGGKSYEEKFMMFAKVVGTAFGNPVKEWAQAELEKYFSIKLTLNESNAREIWCKANEVIKNENLSPRKLIKMSNVEFIATTDDPCDDLRFHDSIRKTDFGVEVTPSFRVDNIVDVFNKGYSYYVKKLAEAANLKLKSLSDFQDVIISRLKFFKEQGCAYSDVGFEFFPGKRAMQKCKKECLNTEVINKTFMSLLNNEIVDFEKAEELMAYLHLFLAEQYKQFNIVMQLHLGVTRNKNTKAFNTLGRDMGYDCVGELDIAGVSEFLDELNSRDLLPKTIIYSLNPMYYYQLITLCGAFTGVHLGISWWFNDHKRGMMETLENVSELAHISSIVGMLTDSRSFLSYARHDYYRQIVCSFLSGYIDETNKKEIESIALDLCYNNAKKIRRGK